MARMVRLNQMLLLLLMATAVVAGMAGPVCATSHQFTWTTKEDFERNASTLGTATARANIDTSTNSGDVTIGLTKDTASGGELTWGASDTLYTIGTDRHSVAVINASSKTLVKTIPLPGRASGIVFNSTNNKIYVGNYNENTVTVIDCGNDTVPQKTVTVGMGAYAAAYNPTLNKIYVGNMSDNTISIIDGADDHVIPKTVAVVAGPYRARFDSERNKLFITNKYNHSVSVLDGASDDVDTTILIEPVVGVIGGSDPDQVGLRVDTSNLSYDKVHLAWTSAPLGSGQNIQFQVRTAETLALLDAARYAGKGGNPDSWYDITGADKTSEPDGDTASIDLDITSAAFVELQLKLSSDDTVSPDLKSVTLNFESYIDLTVSDVSGPATGLIGKSISVSSTATNIGSEPAGAFTVAHYLNDLNGNRTSLNCDRTIMSLAAHAADQASSTCTIPTSLTPGRYYIEAVADPGNQVAEGKEDNNGKLSANTIDITRPYPDLAVASLTVAPLAAEPGASLSLLATITNKGNDSAGAFLVGVSLKDGNGIKNKLSCDGIPVASLADGASTPVGASCIVPPTLAAGAYQVVVCADSDNRVAESNEDNNCAETPFSVIQPDLTVTAVSGPTTGYLGKTISVSTSVTNHGTDSAGSFLVAISLTDGTGAQHIFCDRPVVSLAVDQTSTVATTCTIPATTVPGNYWLEAIADYTNSVPESNEQNNRLVSLLPISILQPYPDLVISAVSGPATGTIGKIITVASTEKNIGTEVAGNHQVAVYLVDSAYLADNTKGTKALLCTRSISSLAETLSDSADTDCTVPGTIGTGSYFVYAAADYLNTVFESLGEGNNSTVGNAITISADLPDFVVTSVSGTMANGKLNYSVKVKNQGKASGVSTGIYLSTDANIDTTDTRIAAVTSTMIQAGEEVLISGTYTIPTNIQPINYYLGAYADYDNKVSEYNENNNSLAGNQVYFYNDLVVTAVSGTVTNGSISYSVTVKNIGTGVANTGTSPIARMYLSTDNAIIGSDISFADVITTQVIVGGGSEHTFTGTVPLPVNRSNLPDGNLLAADYYVGAIVDPYNLSYDSNQSNNALAGNQQYIYNDLVVTAVSGTVTNGNISYSVTVKNIGNGLASTGTGAAVRMFLSTDDAITSSDISFADVTTTQVLAGGGSEHSFTGTVPLPVNRSNLPDGNLLAANYYVGAIVDPYNVSHDPNQSNNALAGNQQYIYNDLVVTAVSGTVTSGRLSYSVTVKNIGNGMAYASPTVRVYLSTDAAITNSDYSVADGSPNRTLAGGGSDYTYTGTSNVLTMPAGSYYVGSIADPYNNSHDTNLPNNALAGNMVTVP